MSFSIVQDHELVLPREAAREAGRAPINLKTARCSTLSRQRCCSQQLAEGAPACFLSGISGWFSLSLGAWVPKNLARRSMASAARGCSTGSGRLGGAAAAGRTMERCRRRRRGGGRDALRYGVSFATTRSQQLAEGAVAARPSSSPYTQQKQSYWCHALASKGSISVRTRLPHRRGFYLPAAP
jgi:hypothetical protein